MFAKERQEEIYAAIQQSGAVTTQDLMQKYHVSIETIRRDLLFMEQSNLLKRVHGGAVAVREMKPFQDLRHRVEENSDRKRDLARIAAAYVQEGDIIGVDAGSTAIHFAESLKERLNRLTVVTHSSDVFDRLAKWKDFRVILCGGHFIKEENAFCGELALDMLNKLHMQKVFLCPSAISLKSGICDYQQELYQIQRKLVECSDHIFVLADSSKFEKNALLKVADMKQEYTYITDGDLPQEMKKIYQENQINIITAGE